MLASEDRFGIGGNKPPPLKERLASEYADLGSLIEQLASRANDAPKEIHDDEVQAPVALLVKDITAAIKSAETHRVAEKEEFLKGGREVDGFFKLLTDRLDHMKRALEARITDYLRAKAAEERRRREEEERKRREEERVAHEEADRKLREAAAAAAANAPAAAELLESAVEANTFAKQRRQETLGAERAAQAKPSDLARTRSDGALSTLKEVWDFEILDVEAVDLVALRAFLPRADVEKAIRAFVKVHKNTRPLTGVNIFKQELAVVR